MAGPSPRKHKQVGQTPPQPFTKKTGFPVKAATIPVPEKEKVHKVTVEAKKKPEYKPPVVSGETEEEISASIKAVQAYNAKRRRKTSQHRLARQRTTSGKNVPAIPKQISTVPKSDDKKYVVRNGEYVLKGTPQKPKRVPTRWGKPYVPKEKVTYVTGTGNPGAVPISRNHNGANRFSTVTPKQPCKRKLRMAQREAARLARQAKLLDVAA